MRGRRHLTPQEIMKQQNMIAREARMAERSTWTTMAVMFGWSMMQGLGFRGKRIIDVVNRVNELHEELEKHPELFQQYKDIVEQKTGSEYYHVDYSTDEITAKKGTYAYQYNAVQIPIQNKINRDCLNYMILYNYALVEKGYGAVRLERMNSAFESIREPFKSQKAVLEKYRRELYEIAGVWFEDPADPKGSKQFSGSLMTGKVVVEC